MLPIFRFEQRATLLRELATMLKAGVPLGEALHALETRPAHPQLRAAMAAGAKHVAAGGRLSEVLGKYPAEFPPLSTAVVAMGEQTGRLDQALDRVAGYLEREYEIRQLVSRETFYPKVILAFCILIPAATPALIEMLMGSFWHGVWIFVRSLLGWALGVGIPLGLGYVVYREVAKTRAGRESLDSLKLAIPLLGPVVRRLALAKFARGLAYTYSAGVPMAEAVALAASVTGNSVLERRFAAAVPLVRQGYKLSEVIAKLPGVEDMTLRMLQTGEQTGSLDATMERVAEHYETAATTSIHHMAVMALPLGVIFCGIIVGFMVVNFYVGYYSGF